MFTKLEQRSWLKLKQVGEGPILPAALARHSSSSCIQSSGVLPKLKFQPSYVCLHGKHPLFLSDFNHLNFLERSSKNTEISLFMNIRPVAAELFHADGHEEADCHFNPNLRKRLLEMPNVC